MRRLHQHKPQQSAWRSAQRQPQSKLGNALAHGIRDHAIGTDRSKNDRQCCKQPNQEKRKARRGNASICNLIHQPHIRDSERRIEPPHLLPNGTHQRLRISVRAYHQRNIRVHALARRPPKGGLGFRAAGFVLHIADLAHNRHPVFRFGIVGKGDSFPDHILAGPIALGKRSIHD